MTKWRTDRSRNTGRRGGRCGRLRRMGHIAVVIGAGVVPGIAHAQTVTMKTIVDFAESRATGWEIVNDGVMGGLSSSDIAVTAAGTALFEGFVSLDNNGGFASTRALLSLDLSAYEGIVLRVRGDGRRYQLRFRTDAAFDGIAYQAEFETVSGEWQEIRLPFGGFQATFRGYVPRGSGPLDPARIRQVGILIGDKKQGSFALEIDWLKAYGRAADADASPGAQAIVQ